VGLYVVAQALNRDFLTDFFRKTKGNFYEGNHHDVTEKLDRDSGSGPKDQADLKKLVEAAREVHPGERLRKLGAVLDLDRFLAFLACEVFTGHRTGYALARDHYRVYHDPTSDRLVFMPEALDALFGGAKDPLVPECHGLVARAVLDSPEGQRLYRAQMATLLASVFKADALQHRLNEWAGRIRPALARDANETRAFEAGVAHLRETVALRAKFLEDELKKPPK
jgi:hypothetical protein